MFQMLSWSLRSHKCKHRDHHASSGVFVYETISLNKYIRSASPRPYTRQTDTSVLVPCCVSVYECMS